MRYFTSFPLIFYGMKRARVGAFTDFGGLRYRNPVHFLGTFSDFGLISDFSGLVYYTGHFFGEGLKLSFVYKNWLSGPGYFIAGIFGI